MQPSPQLEIQNLTMAYGETVIQENLNFTIGKGEIFIIMGGSGCGKSTLLRHMIGLQKPTSGDISVDGVNLWQATIEERNQIISHNGVLYQSGGPLEFDDIR